LKKRKGNFSCDDLSSLFLAARHFLELGTHTWNGANLIPKNLKATKKRLEFLHDKKVSDMTGGEIDECFKGASASYCNAMLRETRSVFNWCMFPNPSRNDHGKVAASNGCSANLETASSISTAFIQGYFRERLSKRPTSDEEEGKSYSPAAAFFALSMKSVSPIGSVPLMSRRRRMMVV